MIKEQETLSSIGHLGRPEIRQDGRYYLNASQAYTDLNILTETWQQHENEAASTDPNLTRVVLRGVVSDEVLNGLQSSHLRDNLEAVMPLDDIGRPNNNLVYLAKNKPERGESNITTEEMMEKARHTEALSDLSGKEPLQRLQIAEEAGYRITTTIPESDHAQLYELWHRTFGWDHDQITALQKRLIEDHDPLRKRPQDQTVWFSAIHDSTGEIMAAAMAERLDVPGVDGPITLVESTEWAVNPNAQSNGLGGAVLSALHAQILSALRHSPNGTPLIFAETNDTSGAFNLGASVGMTKPSREHAPQILRRNVVVGDGIEPEDPRNFHWLHLSQEAIDRYYSDEQVDAMNELLVAPT